MATKHQPLVPLGDEPGDVATQQSHWRKLRGLSSVADAAEQFLSGAGFDRGPWMAVALAAGIGAWFVLDTPAQWVLAMAAGIVVAMGAVAAWKGREDRTRLVGALVASGLLLAFGTGLAWTRSELVGAPAFERPVYDTFRGRVLERIEQPAQDRVRLVLATRHPDTSVPVKIRVNVPLEKDLPTMGEGAVVEFQARLMPPASPMLPGGYDFARTAWFEGYAATGSVQGDLVLLEPAQEGRNAIAYLQRTLSAHVREQLDGSAGSIAAAFASGDRGAISEADEDAMRDAGLTHLLSISGLHVSAVIAGAFLLAIRLLALWPWLVLRVRLPVAAAGIAALAGVGYTLLTGAEVPTVRSCIAALLVLGALALGREPLSLRMVAMAAVAVLLLWPESLVGPSFQMSFSAVIAIVALHNCEPVKRFLAPREESRWARLGRQTVMLLVTGLVIEIALMPIVLFHFHRAGLYGALANVVAIPLVTFISMPLIAMALLLDLAGAGEPVWWLVGQSLDLMLGIAHFTADQPGAVKLIPQMTGGIFALFVAGGLWLALWRGTARLWGFAPAAIGLLLLTLTPVPDILISRDGRHVGITGEEDNLLVLRPTGSDYTRENLMELAGMEGDPIALADWPGARCSPDFCVVTLEREGRTWDVLMSRSREIVGERALAAACERADIVVSDRWLPNSCAPRWLRADRRMLSQSGGLSLVLGDEIEVRSVAETQGRHGWWRGRPND
ncbi:ComEC/Rec2 family competence protein [Aurantiacibacter poecillastricola]|uniref:ComEC/Rec2 family competence protein n=1 Tax=Aurantiacibacter poecillastricola TaxID=3064385 RepID=UPI00273DBD81|nr:ComEC/Rec2 family competence protein [Aurantiacibacter sp. 219JJ12-13]MDP5262104.1 ComEC/Rec2 family competence protein [Aurantiacibacter sp. 219JJ12-13]